MLVQIQMILIVQKIVQIQTIIVRFHYHLNIEGMEKKPGILIIYNRYNITFLPEQNEVIIR